MSGWRRVIRETSDGYAYSVDVPPMPRLNDLFLNSSVYIYPSEAEAQSGHGEGGSGFITTIPGNPPLEQSLHSYIVTAKHVIDRQSKTYVRINRRLGKT